MNDAPARSWEPTAGRAASGARWATISAGLGRLHMVKELYCARRFLSRPGPHQQSLLHPDRTLAGELI